jgi:alpha,alpha-trehalose phosphorylase
MARSNLWTAVTAVRRLRYVDVESYNAMVARLGLDQTEVAEWAFAAEAMHIPFDENLGIHPQDAQFLEKERWNLAETPAANRPLLLHYHPLVIYRFQVLKQADVVLALLLQGDQFTAEQKRADFDYYDPLTTGDSTLSDVVQSIIAAEVGYHELALKYFTSGLFVDLADLHHNAADGVHVASAGGVWSALVYGFGGMRDHNGRITLDPRLPETWEALTFRITLKDTRVRVDLRQDQVEFTVEVGVEAKLAVRGFAFTVRADQPVTVPLEHQGARDPGAPSPAAIEGGRRADGSVITSSIPTIAHVKSVDLASLDQVPHSIPVLR